MGTKKLTLAALVAVACTAAAPAGFIIEDDAVAGNSWSQEIILFDAGGIDFVYFEIVGKDMGAGPFSPTSILSFSDPADPGMSIDGWNTTFESAQIVAGAGPATTLMGVVLHFAGSILAPIELRGVAFRGGEFLFSATFNWDGLTSSGFHLMYLSEFDVWNPDQTSLPGTMIPLPAPLWLGSFGLLAVIVLRRRLL